MSIHVAIHHYTRYEYNRPIQLSPHIFRLRPAPHSRTPIKAYSLRIEPEPHFINWQQDPFGNYLARVVFPEKTRKLSIEVDVVADMTVINPFDFFVEDSAETFPFTYSDQLKRDLAPYLEIREDGERLKAWIDTLDLSEQRTIDFLVKINQQLWELLDYNIRMEPGVQTCEETLERNIGSCRDFAWLLVQTLRHLGLAARFVSGYLVQLTADQKSLDGPSGPEADFTDLHAWAEVYVPGAGWIGLDATSGLFAGEGHIPLACTPEPASAAPVTGFLEEAEPVGTDFTFTNSVTRIHEDPRVTLPYTNAQWDNIVALGRKVDADLQAGDVRLTMGGEPTFVSIDDMESAQWNTAADGEHKRQLAHELVRRLAETFGEHGLLHFSQGKWYPGEPLPRWKLAYVWRKDGQPIWQRPELLADIYTDYGVTREVAENFGRKLATTLAIPPEYLCPGYEDALYFLREEASVPVDVDPHDYDLADSHERRKLVELLSRGLDTPSGYALPVTFNYASQSWESAPWEFRRNRMVLIPGDSPMGLRMPLNALPATATVDLPIERDPLEPVEPLPNPSVETLSPTIIRNVPRTAIVIEPRHGRLHIFMPPISYLEHYLELLTAIEHVAAQINTPVIIEGYEPPRDNRTEEILVTPDPGVIEVNVPPADSWDELVNMTTTLYDQARQSRLGTEKFMLDGRHTGTGGGNHVTLGGRTPADSPFLRRPHVLRSLITFWQHHPSLSYLFSGMFIGPTSQAPRVDEGRLETLYELEIAFDQIPNNNETPSPWLVDRIFRNLLVDLTGNTHRAEFCIDKLYSPDRASGRLGLLEFRAFDMPPHAQMSLTQMLLVRSLVAAFWEKPYRHKLVRWGTELHDRFLLPHYCRRDMEEVVEYLQSMGYNFQMSWLEPFFEFRFPRYGTVQVGDMEMEIRMAIEPWHVLGEESTNQGTSRFVDSSAERVQIKISGMIGERYIVTCNGRRVPLRSTGVAGEYVAGIRYQAWSPPSALHPTIGIHAPLVFDIVDSWNKRAVGGCTYHVAHPGGRNYEDTPVNANVAEARRVSRFDQFGHTPGAPFVAPLFRNVTPPPMRRDFTPTGSDTTEPVGELPSIEVNAEYPHTLDLRTGRAK